MTETTNKYIFLDNWEKERENEYFSKKKVLAYITRKINNSIELLIHRHVDIDEAGLQIPAGTIEYNETVKEALFREIQEESGLCDLNFIKKLGTTKYLPEGRNEVHERHYFLLETNISNDTWRHKIKSNGEDDGLIFEYKWYKLDKIPKLAAKQDELVLEIKEYYNYKLS